MRESSLLRAVGKYLDSQPDVWWVKLRATPGSRRGLPDIVGCVRGRFFAIELKRPAGILSAHQARELEKIKVASGSGSVARNLAEVEVFIEGLRHDAGERA